MNDSQTAIDQNPLPSEQLFQARLKANDYVENYLKQLIALSTGSLVLTITFLKNLLGPHAASAKVTWCIPWAWVFLAFSIFAGVLGLATLTKNLDTPDPTTGRTGLPRAFLAGSRVMIFSAQPAILAFAIAMAFLATFAISNHQLFFQTTPPSTAEKVAIRAEEAAKKAEMAAVTVSTEVNRIINLLKTAPPQQIPTIPNNPQPLQPKGSENKPTSSP